MWAFNSQTYSFKSFKTFRKGTWKVGKLSGDVKQEVGGKYSTSERLDVRKVVIESSIKAVWGNVEKFQSFNAKGDIFLAVSVSASTVLALILFNCGKPIHENCKPHSDFHQ